MRINNINLKRVGSYSIAGIVIFTWQNNYDSYLSWPMHDRISTIVTLSR